MPELINKIQAFSLLEVTSSIQKTINKRYKSPFWVKAEMVKLNFYNKSGHCYPDLVEKKENKIVAQMRSTIWKDDYQRIAKRFKEVTKEELKGGINILFQAKVDFRPTYGLSLHILDIEPGFTLGELVREKQDTIDKLKKENIFNNNKLLPLAKLPQRIAVISVETSKGYSDFTEVLNNNNFNYAVFHMLFSSLLQGEQAVKQIIYQLNRIKKVIHHFDAVAIIRGGGGDIGLTCYNNYKLSKEVALFPIPVLTGIGHSTNETVVEMVAYKNSITPTKLADFLIQAFHNFAVPVKDGEKAIIQRAQQILYESKIKLTDKIKYYISITSKSFEREQANLIRIADKLKFHSTTFIKYFANIIERAHGILSKDSIIICNKQKEMLKQNSNTLIQTTRRSISDLLKVLEQKEKEIELLHPKNVLKRGFSITYFQGKSITDISKLKQGDLIVTELDKGNIESTVENIKKPSWKKKLLIPKRLKN